MKFLREHIIYKIIAFTLALSLLVPIAVKFTHAFNHYKHEVCLGEKTTHLHKMDFDCKFYKFKFSSNFILKFYNFNVFPLRKKQFEIVSQYYFLSSYQQLHFSLRGPPSLV